MDRVSQIRFINDKNFINKKVPIVIDEMGNKTDLIVTPQDSIFVLDKVTNGMQFDPKERTDDLGDYDAFNQRLYNFYHYNEAAAQTNSDEMVGSDDSDSFGPQIKAAMFDSPGKQTFTNFALNQGIQSTITDNKLRI